MSDVIPIRVNASDLAMDAVSVPVLGMMDQRRALLAQGPYSAFNQALSHLDEVVNQDQQGEDYVSIGRLGTAYLRSSFVGVFPSTANRPAPRLLIQHYQGEQLVNNVFDIIPEPSWAEADGRVNIVVVRRRYSGMPNHEKVSLLDEKLVSARKALSLTRLVWTYKSSDAVTQSA